ERVEGTARELHAHRVVERRPQALLLLLVGLVRRVLHHFHSPVALVAEPVRLLGVHADARIDDHRAAAHLRHLLCQAEQPGFVEVVEDPETQDDVELAVAGDRRVADVVDVHFVAGKPEGAGGKTGLLRVRRPALDAHHRGAVARALDPVYALEAGEIQDAQFAERALRDVRDDLEDAPYLDLDPDVYRAERVDFASEMVIVAGPLAMLAFEGPLRIGEVARIRLHEPAPVSALGELDYYTTGRFSGIPSPRTPQERVMMITGCRPWRSAAFYLLEIKCLLLLAVCLVLKPLLRRRFTTPVWVIGENFGRCLRDNGYCFFLWCRESGTVPRVLFVARREFAARDPALSGSADVLVFGSFRHLLHVVQADVVIYTHTRRDIIHSRLFPLACRGKRIVWLKHGVYGF